MVDRVWVGLAETQAGLLSHRQLRELGVSRGEIRNHVRVRRWAVRSSEVVSTTTGPLSREQALWLGVLHGGPTAMTGALCAYLAERAETGPTEQILTVACSAIGHVHRIRGVPDPANPHAVREVRRGLRRN